MLIQNGIDLISLETMLATVIIFCWMKISDMFFDNHAYFDQIRPILMWFRGHSFINYQINLSQKLSMIEHLYFALFIRLFFILK